MSVVQLAAAAILAISVLFIRWRRPQLALTVMLMILAAIGWNLIRGFREPGDFSPGILTALNVMCVQAASVMFFATCRRLVHGRWRASFLWWAGVTVFAILCGLSMLPVFGITTGESYYTSWAFVVHLIYCFVLLGLGAFTLMTRQHDPSNHVRRYIAGTEICLVVLLALQMTLPDLAPLAKVPLGLLAVWTTGHVPEWSRSSARADRLVDSIGVFILVVDSDGLLLDWNGPAASLLALSGITAEQGLDIHKTLGVKPPFNDNSIVELTASGGLLRTTMTVHRVDPTSLDHDLVLMLRPLNSSMESSSFPPVSGVLAGYDPATQTLCRRTAMEEIRTAADNNSQIIRVDVRSAASDRADDLMFVVARRLEARAADLGWPDMQWARLDTWTFIGVLTNDHSVAVMPPQVEVTDLGVSLRISAIVPTAEEPCSSFVQRVLAAKPADFNGKTVSGS
ncbi:MAG TPA: hypothetical protein PLQ19_06440 [Aeromicrobium sp.]|nr:hypothetical protein [Aeromicrobium sp.]